MAKFANAAEAVTKALSIVDAQIANVEMSEQLELYLELIYKRSIIQQAQVS